MRSSDWIGSKKRMPPILISENMRVRQCEWLIVQRYIELKTPPKMKKSPKSEEPCQYVTYNGSAKLQRQQTAKMTLSERLDALDEMIGFAQGLHGTLGVAKVSGKYPAD